MEPKDVFADIKDELDKLLHIIMESTFSGLIITDIKGIIVYSNSSCEKILGIKREEIENKKFSQVIGDKGINKEVFKLKFTVERSVIFKGRDITIRITPFFKDNKHIFNIITMKNIFSEVDQQYELTKLEQCLDIMKDILDNEYQGMVLLDAEGRIVKFNYEKLLGIKEEDVLGKHVDEVIDNTRLHIVVKTGKKEMNDIQRIQGKDMIANRIPIMKEGKVIGAIGSVIFNDIRELKPLIQRMETYEKTFDKYKGEIKMMHEARYSFDHIISQNKRMEHLKEVSNRAAESNSTVLIQGESGTGKEYFAHGIHKASHRRYGAFVRINCAAIPKELLEAELFGYEEGAFTGARKEGKLGKLEIANGGTVLLDEIGTMPLEMQAKLLRVLEEREFERIGGTERIALDIRVIASTNEELEEAISKGKFRQDLYYRLNVIRLNIPPLRERLDDIPLLAKHMIQDLSSRLDIEPKEIAPETMEILQNYSWPGNVRELRNVIESALNLVKGNIIFPEYLPEHMIIKGKSAEEKKENNLILKDIVAQAELKAIREALIEAKGNRTEAAKLLGIHRTALYKKLDAYGLNISML
ncbi:PAS domain S-box-containing protein [Proteiniborus ethanoligenes]|uniref:PAS domain S-box-containing protein n=1 Tax=Proteiniborus ethanoligenes TaxID=415015 RepID=A0A1H3S7Q5_9FIRM|nr:sigma 54-interacting transcriptional regulator [Proteiniborus ethanoligenes]SDZ33992.1 PAS domain S-box-containing protein [Proteiniborus ethanoligenes]